jgi:predicted thioesterase
MRIADAAVLALVGFRALTALTLVAPALAAPDRSVTAGAQIPHLPACRCGSPVTRGY